MWAAPREACARCKFASLCDDGRRQDRDISLVQGIHATTRLRLINSGLATIDALAQASDEQRPPRVAEETFDRLRAQAAIQVEGEDETPPLYEVVNSGELALLPPRSPGDIWFDMEGDPYAPGANGLEYMFGYGFLDGGEFDFKTLEAHNPTQERIAFEGFIDEVMRRRNVDPGMHVYHYANYEQRALQRLAQQYGTRELEIDLLLKEGRFIDLYKIVQRALRFSTESLSLKYIEAVYGVTHSGEDVSTAMDSVIQYEAYVALMADGKEDEANVILTNIRSYNKLDCKSTMQLDSWLRTLDQTSTPLAGENASADDNDAVEPTDPHLDLVLALEAGLPTDPDQRSKDEQARALLASALLYHSRERRPAWWKLFELIKAEPEELERASNVLLVNDAIAIDWSKTPRMKKHRRDIELISESEDPRLVLDDVAQVFLLYDPAPEGMAQPSDSLRGYNSADTSRITATSVDVTERAGRDDAMWADVPIAVLPGQPYNTTPIQNAIAQAARSVLPENNGGEWRFPDLAWADLLLSRPPRTASGSLPATGAPIDDICAALEDSQSSYVAVQGPPGTGKTYIGSRSVARLAQQGWRIGVVAQSHAVVDNFLAAVHKFDASVELGKEPPGGTNATSPWHITSKLDAWALARPHGYVIGGTAWTFSRESIRDLQLDLLVIDEAGQFALANTIACSLAAQRVLLLGDPQQLPQVSQAAHPEGIEQSVLERVITGHATMPADRGYFLDHTYRMHPELTEAVSRLQYEGRLGSAAVTRLRSLEGFPPGITATPVDHHGNTTSSPEEAHKVVETIQALLGREWIDARDDQQQPPRRIVESDILIVAAYNAQVRLIKRQLEHAGLGDVEVGTVDKFQGKEAPIVIVSMATSSA
ncbi:MAG TPA: TM0106 family RecB-like putative nuclease, partial [Acidimicrobiia bacterium]